MINTVLFDLDGTLADTAADLANALNATRLQRDLPKLPIETIRPVVSLGSGAMIKLAFNLEKGEPDFNPICNEFLQYYLENIANETRLFEGIEAVLLSIENDNKAWGIVTNKSTRLTNPLLEALSLDRRAACVVSGDTVAHYKPHPDPILHACTLMKSVPESTIYIGDAQRDIEAGRRAGTKTLVALYGYITDNDDPANWQADGMVTNAINIIDKLDEFSH